MGELDLGGFLTLNGLASHSAWLDALMVFAARYLVYLLGLAALVPWLVNRFRGRAWAMRGCAWRMPAAGFVAAASSFVGNWLVSFVWFRPRPFIDVPGVHLLVPPPLTAYSFPSSHSAAAFAIAFTVVFFHRRFGLALVAAAALVALSRVFVGVHYPLDILVGGAFGIGWAALGARIFGADVCVWRPLSTSGKTTSGTE